MTFHSHGVICLVEPLAGVISCGMLREHGFYKTGRWLWLISWRNRIKTSTQHVSSAYHTAGPTVCADWPDAVAPANPSLISTGAGACWCVHSCVCNGPCEPWSSNKHPLTNKEKNLLNENLKVAKPLSLFYKYFFEFGVNISDYFESTSRIKNIS